MRLTVVRSEKLDELAAEVEALIGDVPDSLANLQGDDLEPEDRAVESDEVVKGVGEVLVAAESLFAEARGRER